MPSTTLLETSSAKLPDEFSLSPGDNPGEFKGNDGATYCLASTAGTFDLDPAAQERYMLDVRMVVLEKSVAALAAERAGSSMDGVPAALEGMKDGPGKPS